MIVYAESNFVLELAFLQEECEQAEQLVGLADSKEIQLIIPAFSGSEPYERMTRRKNTRQELHDRLAAEVRELKRSSPYIGIDETTRGLNVILSESASEEKARLDATLGRLTNISTMIPLTGDVLRTSIDYQSEFALGPQDAIVFASVVSHLQSQDSDAAKLLVTRNVRDFSNQDISDLLSRHSCKLLFRFTDAVGYIQSRLRRDGQ